MPIYYPADRPTLETKAPTADPTFTGDPKAPTPASDDNDTSLATTAFVKALIEDSIAGSGFQPLDADLTAIAELLTTPFGRSLLTLADSAALQAAAGAGATLEVFDEGVSQTSTLLSLDFVGENVTAVDDGSGNVTVTVTGSSALEGTSGWELTVAASDETTALTTGDAKTTFYMDSDVTLEEVFIGLSDPSSSGSVTIDVRKNGVTIFATPPSIQVGEDTSLTGVAAVLATTSFVKGDKIEIDIDASGTNAKGLKVTFLGRVLSTVNNNNVSVFDRGSISTGTETPEPSEGALHTATNDGAHTLAPPTETGYYILTYVNGAAAGIITATGWDAVLDPDTVLGHTVQNSVVECAVLNDGVTSRLQVTLIVDATP